MKNTFSHTICAFAATSKAAIGFADRHKKIIRNGDIKMKKVLASILALAMLVVTLTACSGGTSSESSSGAGTDSATDSAAENGSDELVLYTWESMFPQEVLDAFEQETGIRVNYVNFDTDETMLARLEAAEGGDYDIVVADDYIIETAIAEGLVTELDKTQLPSFGNINPIYQGQFFDPEDKYTVPYGRRRADHCLRPEPCGHRDRQLCGPVGFVPCLEHRRHEQFPRHQRHGAQGDGRELQHRGRGRH